MSLPRAPTSHTMISVLDTRAANSASLEIPLLPVHWTCLPTGLLHLTSQLYCCCCCWCTFLLLTWVDCEIYLSHVLPWQRWIGERQPKKANGVASRALVQSIFKLESTRLIALCIAHYSTTYSRKGQLIVHYQKSNSSLYRLTGVSHSALKASLSQSTLSPSPLCLLFSYILHYLSLSSPIWSLSLSPSI